LGGAQKKRGKKKQKKKTDEKIRLDERFIRPIRESTMKEPFLLIIWLTTSS